MIDVIIPTYKPDKYLFDCLFSLKNQSLSCDFFSVKIILNGAKDPYFDNIKIWVDELELNNCNIFYTYDKGVSVARNYGLELSNSQYICFVDDDDILSSNYLEVLLENSSESTIAVANTLSFYNDISEKRRDYLSIIESKNSNSIIKYRRFLSNSCSKMIPRKLIDNVRFNNLIHNGEDSLFMFEISNNIKNINMVCLSCVYYRRLRFSSLSRSQYGLKKRFKMMFMLGFFYLKIYFKNPFKYSLLLLLTRILAVSKRFIFILK